jgi:hypothetical protein
MLVRYCSYFKFDMLRNNSKINEMKKDTIVNIDLECLAACSRPGREEYRRIGACRET